MRKNISIGDLMAEKRQHAVLMDVSGFIHRAWFMAPRQMDEDGREIGATRLLGMMLLKIAHKMRKGSVPPTHLVALFDEDGPNEWRRAIYPAYKSARPLKDPDLVAQLPLMRSMCESMGLMCASSPTHEADDLIAAYAKDASDSGMRVSVMSADKDLMQLVRRGVMQMNPLNGAWFNEAAVQKKFGVPPSLVADSLALTGDSVDSIPGVEGIGPKIAASLLNEFGSLDEIIRKSSLISRDRLRIAIEESHEILTLSRRLVALDADGATRPFGIEDAVFPDVFDVGRAYEDWVSNATPTGAAPR